MHLNVPKFRLSRVFGNIDTTGTLYYFVVWLLFLAIRGKLKAKLVTCNILTERVVLLRLA